MKENYQLKMEKIIEGLEGRKKLLLHACCAPCATYVTEYLQPFFDITLFYYNPNTHPYSEYVKRFDSLKKLSSVMQLNIINGNYDDIDFFEKTSGLTNEPEGGKRCTECFKMRLFETAKTAKKRNYDMFATTLTVSPHKNAEIINSIGYDAQNLFEIDYLPSDFKKKNGFKRSIELSEMFDLYRQNYCGCTYSLR